MAIIRITVSSKSKPTLLEIGLMEYALWGCKSPYKVKICDIDIDEFGEDTAFSIINHILEHLPIRDGIVYDVEKIITN